MESIEPILARTEIVRSKLATKSPMHFGELLETLTLCDAGLVNLTLEENEELLKRTAIKVDNYKYLLEKLEAESERLKKRIDEFKFSRSAVDNKIESVKKLLLKHMEAQGFTKLPGEDFKVSVTESEFVEVKTDATYELFTEFPAFIKPSYAWDKPMLKEALKKKEFPKIEEVAELKKAKHARFSVNKVDL